LIHQKAITSYALSTVARMSDDEAAPSVRSRPVAEDDPEIFRRFLTEPGLIGLA
jgi:hypothetical protein